MLAECRRLASFRMPLIIGAVAVVSCGTDGLGAMPGDWHRKRVERYTIGEKVLPPSANRANPVPPAPLNRYPEFDIYR